MEKDVLPPKVKTEQMRSFRTDQVLMFFQQSFLEKILLALVVAVV